MSGRTLSYAVVTPVRNDEQNLRSLADSLAAQTVLPERWIIADNGSTDSTTTAAQELSSMYPWVTALDASTSDQLMRGAPIVRAFHLAIEELDFEPDVVVKLDADITVDRDYFERLLAEFDADPGLGIAGGICYEQGKDGIWRQRHSTGAGVWGANRAYRWPCLRTILPLEERMGWDTIDLVKAMVHGWHARVFRELPFQHHRAEGERDGSRARTWATQGRAAHYMGYRFSYLLVRTLYRSLQEPAAVGLLWGYIDARLRREPACADAEVRAFMRRAQSLRRLPLRIREARRPRAQLDRHSI